MSTERGHATFPTPRAESLGFWYCDAPCVLKLSPLACSPWLSPHIPPCLWLSLSLASQENHNVRSIHNSDTWSQLATCGKTSQWVERSTQEHSHKWPHSARHPWNRCHVSRCSLQRGSRSTGPPSSGDSRKGNSDDRSGMLVLRQIIGCS